MGTINLGVPRNAGENSRFQPGTWIGSRTAGNRIDANRPQWPGVFGEKARLEEGNERKAEKRKQGNARRFAEANASWFRGVEGDKGEFQRCVERDLLVAGWIPAGKIGNECSKGGSSREWSWKRVKVAGLVVGRWRNSRHGYIGNGVTDSSRRR